MKWSAPSIQLDLKVHLEDGTVVTAEPTTILIPPSQLLARARDDRNVNPLGPTTPIAIVAAALHKVATTVAHITKEYQDGHRRTTRDRDDSRTSNDPGVAAEQAVLAGLTSTISARLPASLPPDPGEVARPSLIESTAADPIIAYKLANLAWGPNGDWSFRSLRGHNYDTVARARCYPSGPRQNAWAHVPLPECTCGFYACTDRTAVHGSGAVLLDVALYGRVIVCERGYRAEKQRILRVELRGCHWCGAAPCILRLSACSLEPLCEHHRQQLLTEAPDAMLFTPEVLAERLGVPVT